ncbi:MAG: hypothetical protein R3B60_03810 [Candidatus Paceibacterota bacterium]
MGIIDTYFESDLPKIIIEEERCFRQSGIELSCSIKMPPNTRLVVSEEEYDHSFYVMGGDGWYFACIHRPDIINLSFVSEGDDFNIYVNNKIIICSGDRGLVLHLDKKYKTKEENK